VPLQTSMTIAVPPIIFTHPRILRGDSAHYIDVASGITPGYPRMIFTCMYWHFWKSVFECPFCTVRWRYVLCFQWIQNGDRKANKVDISSYKWYFTLDSVCFCVIKILITPCYYCPYLVSFKTSCRSRKEKKLRFMVTEKYCRSLSQL